MNNVDGGMLCGGMDQEGGGSQYLMLLAMERLLMTIVERMVKNLMVKNLVEK